MKKFKWEGKGKRFTGTIINDPWTKTRGGGWEQRREEGMAGVVGKGRGKAGNYMNNNKMQKYFKKYKKNFKWD